MKMRILIPLIVVVLIGATSCFTASNSHKVYPETQAKGDTLVHFRSTNAKPKQVNDTLIYHWTKLGKVNTTKGHFVGRLLQAEYTEMVGDRIVRSGNFRQGLKDGKWKTWERDQLQSIYSWKNGVLDGDYTLFDEQGAVVEKGSYKNGKKKDEE